ncbi:MAG: methylmalonyl-CoA mutase [Oscillibacter sp.]|nr:methylmalonyl-CoA mutase [Oscillibacter sp.]MCI9376168.1 methylmalonyl-CoA mutase [Oscillibacter sp.]
MELKVNRRFNEKELPDMKTLLSEGEKIAKTVTIGESLFMKTYGVRSEAEYKRKMMQTGHVMKHTHIGWNSVSATAEGFQKIYEALKESGSYVDRFGVCLDGSMGVPAEYRDRIQVGTGQVYKTPEEWKILSRQVPVQVHMGDHMIGSLNSVENCVNALSAGVTTIGNISHYYSYEYPGLDMEYDRTIKACEAIAVMGYFREQGAAIHSNLDDGMGSQFHDLANLAGWARLERYIVEDLLGGGMNFCFGNLFSDPILRIIFNKAMWNINTHQTPGSMIYGNTIDFGTDIPRNYGALSSFALADVIGQMKYPTGHAVCAIPVTEAIRVPSAEEIIESHHTLDIMMEKARYYMDYIDFGRVEAEAKLLNVSGNVFFERVMNALDDLGVDITHAGQIMAVLKGIGAEQLEINFGVGRKDELAMRGREPVRPTNIIQTISATGEQLIARMPELAEKPLEGVNVVIGATDIHVFGKEVIKKILRVAGANVYDLGDATPVEEFADTLIETESKILVVSTYNGMAYSFADAMVKKLKELHLDDVKFLMGGRLNEAMEGKDLPEDVSGRLAEMGVNVDNNAETIVETIRRYSA